MLRKNFVEQYDYLSWVNRVAWLDLVISNPEFSAKIESATKELMGENGPHPSVQQIINTSKLELHFTAYHSTESLLGLLFGFLIEPSLPWVWLTCYRPVEFAGLVNQLAEKGLAMFGTDEESIARTLFFNSTEPKYQVDIDTSVKFAVTYFKMLAKEFQNKADYNSYKHGLRTLKLHEFRAQLGNVKWEELATIYLDITDPIEVQNELVSDLHLVVKAIDYERSERIIIANTKLMHNLFEIQKAIATQEGTQKGTLCLFGKDDATQILRPTKTGNVMNTMVLSPDPLVKRRR